MSAVPCNSPVILALDYCEETPVLALLEQLSPQQCRLKVGKELFTACGPSLVKRLVASGFDVFLDLKFHDIPNTVAQAVSAARDLGVWMVNVHASGGARMLEAARTALSGKQDTLLIAVTVLTSMTEDELRGTGVSRSLVDHIAALADLAQTAGLDGVVCSAQEAGMLRTRCGDEFLRITPGIRPLGSVADDQRRIVTPEEAMKTGSSYLVIGRPVTRAPDPAAALSAINRALAC